MIWFKYLLQTEEFLHVVYQILMLEINFGVKNISFKENFGYVFSK